MIAVGLAIGVALLGSGPAEPPAEGRAVVWAVGDGANGNTIARRLARRIERDDPDAVLYLGDVYPSGTAEDYEHNWKPVYGRLAPRIWPTVGNHEWANRDAGYRPYWRRYRRARPWYRFDVGGWEALSLNSEAAHDAGSSQVRWLKRVLDENDTTCRLAFWHRPRVIAGTVHEDAPDVAPLWRSLQGRARLVLNGHEHVMARYRRVGSLTEYVSGAGSDIRYGLQPDSRRAFGRSDRAGALRMVLTPGEARLEFRDIFGRVLDRSHASCRTEGP